ncbi:bifunctional metallophosphatase/5'-nucleotidase [Isobaculum melis]|uniref:2',3'-cyclic-nucleotide 2'-phosphodiesterase/5'-or 3'-nucleotidase, 5'-nucleotidase family n=1 Tax=Isobaculum melis TaxID=142588 RepID=A0A1H9QQY7_9LACT|nr:bifunctional metallophosphatase/5'-nucleotidase [Isobaculum melis]SER62830.1 2',3'-cyclic-nucleotide 2'-phosphodiesterase/5'-or 3'-nucleotidase, 5'-nucleotidase family [Isobaculum melis]
METITIYHTNDLHSHFENWPRISHYLNEQAAQQKQAYIFDIGDAMDRVHPLSEATAGQANIAALNEVPYQAVTIGNNEGIGNSKIELNQLYQEAQFDVILSNLYDHDTGRMPNWVKPYDILITESGFRIGICALTASFPETYGPNGWDVLLPDEVLPALIAELTPQVDTILLLSHLGFREDQRIAKAYPEIAVILGAHTHHLLPEGFWVNQTLLAAAGKFGQYIGEITLSIEAHQIIKKTAVVQEVALLPAREAENEQINHYQLQGEQLLSSQKVANLQTDYPLHWSGESALVKLGLKAMKAYTKTEVAILSAGLFLRPLSAGIVTRKELHELLPHPMRPTRVTLTGANIDRMIREMEKNRHYLRQFPVKGMGFRGKVFGEICYDGISYEAATKTVYWQGKPLDFKKEYTFSTVDHYIYLPFFPTIEICGKTEVLFPYFFRDIYGMYLRKNYPID